MSYWKWTHRSVTGALLGTLMLVGVGAYNLPRPAMSQTQVLATEGVRAPEFPTGFTWFNTQKPLSLRALRGKVVLLDFWTYGCINCMHVLPDLKKLEQKYAQELVVISVHSAKFETESDAKNIRNALLRYNIDHPVLVDQKMKVWTDYTVRAWPTFVVIDPAGRVVGTTAGEGRYDLLDRTIASTVEQFRKRGELNLTPLNLTLERAAVTPQPLAYPGKVLAQDGKLYIADSNHNRIVVADQEGKVLEVIGSGAALLRDGTYSEAAFHNPQGLALQGDYLFVADTNNHALRAINLRTRSVATLAGDGTQAPWRSTGGSGRKARLSSPWDVLSHGDYLYLAMAGTHQIWRYQRSNQKVEVFAGDGSEARRDGDLYSSAFAQPSGLALAQADGKEYLLVADSEISCIRRIELEDAAQRRGRVTTLAGGDLFEFGDKDGVGDAVRLQHPLGVVTESGKGNTALLADTYNGKIKRLDWKTGQVNTVYAGGLDEPGGLSLDGTALFVADTNNHRIQKLNLQTGQATPINLTGLNPPAARLAQAQALLPGAAPAVQLAGAAQKLAPSSQAQLLVDIRLPAGFKLNLAAPQQATIKVTGTGLKASVTTLKGAAVKLPLRVPVQTGSSGQGTLQVSVFINYCSEGDGAICKAERVQQTLTYQVAAGGSTSLRSATVQLP